MIDTIWSHIIWQKLGYNYDTYKIHEEPFEKTCDMVLDYFKSKSSVDIEETLREITYTDIDDRHAYYDGFFTKLASKEGIVFHDTQIQALVIQIILTHVDLFDKEMFEFIEKIRQMYVQKFKDEERPTNFELWRELGDSLSSREESIKKSVTANTEWLLNNDVQDEHYLRYDNKQEQ